MMRSASSDTWSDALRAQTLKAVEKRDLLAARDDQIYFKHIASGFETMAAEDLQHGLLKIMDLQTEQEITFIDAAALVAAGWVLD